MAKQKKSGQQERHEVTAVERLGLRISSMINSPRAQERCCALIHRLDSDQDEEWNEIMGQISEVDGVAMIFRDDGAVLLEWEAPSDEDRVLEVGEVDLVEEPAPF